MKYLVTMAIIAASVATAVAQQPVSPEFVPIVIDKPKLDQFLVWLNEQPGRFSVPMTDFLRTWEQSAVMAIEEARKAKETKKTGDKK